MAAPPNQSLAPEALATRRRLIPYANEQSAIASHPAFFKIKDSTLKSAHFSVHTLLF